MEVMPTVKFNVANNTVSGTETKLPVTVILTDPIHEYKDKIEFFKYLTNLALLGQINLVVPNLKSEKLPPEFNMQLLSAGDGIRIIQVKSLNEYFDTVNQDYSDTPKVQVSIPKLELRELTFENFSVICTLPASDNKGKSIQTNSLDTKKDVTSSTNVTRNNPDTRRAGQGCYEMPLTIRVPIRRHPLNAINDVAAVLKISHRSKVSSDEISRWVRSEKDLPSDVSLNFDSFAINLAIEQLLTAELNINPAVTTFIEIDIAVLFDVFQEMLKESLGCEILTPIEAYEQSRIVLKKLENELVTRDAKKEKDLLNELLPAIAGLKGKAKTLSSNFEKLIEIYEKNVNIFEENCKKLGLGLSPRPHDGDLLKALPLKNKVELMLQGYINLMVEELVKSLLLPRLKNFGSRKVALSNLQDRIKTKLTNNELLPLVLSSIENDIDIDPRVLEVLVLMNDIFDGELPNICN